MMLLDNVPTDRVVLVTAAFIPTLARMGLFTKAASRWRAGSTDGEGMLSLQIALRTSA